MIEFQVSGIKKGITEWSNYAWNIEKKKGKSNERMKHEQQRNHCVQDVQ